MPEPETAYRVVIVISQGIAAPHIMRDLAAGFESLGHEILLMDVRDIAAQDLNAHLLARREDIVTYKPHFTAFYNSAGLLPKPPGLPESGTGMHFFEALQIPCAALFFDSPLLPVFLQDINILHATPMYNLFVWDKEHLSRLNERFTESHYLPLGTNPDIFYPRDPDPAHDADVAFIGSVADSDDFNTQRSAQGWPPLLVSLAEQVFKHWKTSRNPDLNAILNAMADTMKPDLAGAVRTFTTNAEQYTMFQQSILAQIARAQRWDCIHALPRVETRVYGGPGWENIALDHVTPMPPVDYHHEAPVVYSSANINLNITSVQLAHATNQRTFDVPACGGFLLTDYRQAAAELFEPGTEIAMYRTTDELAAQVKHFLQHDDERRAMAQAARNRVLREHTWAHRARTIINVLKDKNLIP